MTEEMKEALVFLKNYKRPTLNKDFARSVKGGRLAKSLTLHEVQSLTGIPHTTYFTYENGQIINPCPHRILKIAQALDLNYTTLMRQAGYYMPSRCGGV